MRLFERARRDGVDLQRLRRQVAFDRLLARLFAASQHDTAGWVLKGGYALELRLDRARSTKDVDLAVPVDALGPASTGASAALLRERLQSAASVPSGDWFTFIVGELTIGLDGAPGGGYRFPVEARMDGRIFGQFHVDLGVGDEVLLPLDRVTGEDWLSFAGIPAVQIPVLSAEQQ